MVVYSKKYGQNTVTVKSIGRFICCIVKCASICPAFKADCPCAFGIVFIKYFIQNLVPVFKCFDKMFMLFARHTL